MYWCIGAPIFYVIIQMTIWQDLFYSCRLNERKKESYILDTSIQDFE